MLAPFGVLAAGLIGALVVAGDRRQRVMAQLPRRAKLMSRRAQSLRTSAASKITRLPHAWRGLTSRVETLSSMLAFEAAAAEEQLSALAPGATTETRALHEARLLGAVAELEALYAAVQKAAGGDDPEAGRRALEELVKARGWWHRPQRRPHRSAHRRVRPNAGENGEERTAVERFRLRDSRCDAQRAMLSTQILVAVRRWNANAEPPRASKMSAIVHAPSRRRRLAQARTSRRRAASTRSVSRLRGDRDLLNGLYEALLGLPEPRESGRTQLGLEVRQQPPKLQRRAL